MGDWIVRDQQVRRAMRGAWDLRDRELRDAVAAQQARYAALRAGSIGPLPPSEGLWRRVLRGVRRLRAAQAPVGYSFSAAMWRSHIAAESQILQRRPPENPRQGDSPPTF